MTYLEVVQLFKKIEKEHDVMSIKYKSVSIWPYLRIYLIDSMTAQRAVGYTSSALSILLKSLFKFNPLRFFRKYQIWNYSSSTTRKQIGNLYEHHVSGYLHKSPYSLLTIEFQSPGVQSISRAKIPETNIVSGSWSLVLTALIEILLRPLKQKIDGEDVIKEIVDKLGVSFDYKRRLRWLIAQKATTDFYLSISHKPQLFIIECSYTQMGRIMSAHKHNIPVVELQHGVLNANHYAYNTTYHSDLFYPDEICVYGVEEYNYFTKVERTFVNKVTATGLYILDRSGEYFKDDLFAKDRKIYNRIAVVAGQVGGEERLSEFIDSVASKLNDVLFIYIPRHIIELKFKSPNVRLKIGVNIYEYLKWCDFHVTISSTTGLEAHFFKKPILFCDFNNVAKEYYGRIINEVNGAFYIHTEEEFINKLSGIKQSSYEYKELFAHNSEEKIQTVLDRYLKESTNN